MILISKESVHKCEVGVREYECPGFDLSRSKEEGKVLQSNL